MGLPRLRLKVGVGSEIDLRTLLETKHGVSESPGTPTRIASPWHHRTVVSQTRDSTTALDWVNTSSANSMSFSRSSSLVAISPWTLIASSDS